MINIHNTDVHWDIDVETNSQSRITKFGISFSSLFPFKFVFILISFHSYQSSCIYLSQSIHKKIKIKGLHGKIDTHTEYVYIIWMHIKVSREVSLTPYNTTTISSFWLLCPSLFPIFTTFAQGEISQLSCISLFLSLSLSSIYGQQWHTATSIYLYMLYFENYPEVILKYSFF